MSEKQTPMMRQYLQMKQKNPDAILLFRMGDFFETFLEDAAITAKVCGITLTKRNSGGDDTNLAGFPHHQLDAYLPKLVRAGYRVAVCEQLEDPKLARGIVRRGIVEVVTPGVALYDKLLTAKNNNYLACLSFKTAKDKSILFGIACVDISTGEFVISEFSASQLHSVIENFRPSEIIFNKSQVEYIQPEIDKLNFKPATRKIDEWLFDEEFSREAIRSHFETNSLKGFGIDDYSIAIAAAGATMHYIKETQVTQLDHIKSISVFNPNDYMTLDYATRRNLEITFSANDGSENGTLFNILDDTCTPMGGRLLKKWVTRPLLDLQKINQRLDAVESLLEKDNLRSELRLHLNHIGDIERLVSKICNGRANPRDVVALKNSIAKLPEIKACLLASDNIAIVQLASRLYEFEELRELIDSAIIDEPSVQLGTANVFKSGYNSNLDEYVDAKKNGNEWLKKYQEDERSNTEIPSLKVGFNNVFGYYIEITKTHQAKAPDRYERRQTLANAERYITPELKEFENKIFSAEEKILEFEQALFTELRMKIAISANILQENAYYVASIDCLQSFATISKENNYCKPRVEDSEVLEIKDGRHPVVEKLLPVGEKFIPNNTSLDCKQSQIHIITGPNMSGKSCYLRQLGLIVLLGQIGCYVPATSARFGIVDRIFTRVGASDNITSGESTFLVEMQEAANILHNATKKSLILLDEIGRGTATFDGISIAWAMTEYIHDSIGAKTLFATHYHELNELAENYDRITNYQVQVIETYEKVLFSHKVIAGGADHSFGIYVAKMAGVPNLIINRSKEIMQTLELNSQNTSDSKVKAKKVDASKIPHKKRTDELQQISIFEIRDDMIRERLRNVDLDNITPFKAMELLHELKEKFI